MVYAQIENNVVVNVVLADEEFAIEHNLILLPESAGIGWLYFNNEFSAPLVELANQAQTN